MKWLNIMLNYTFNGYIAKNWVCGIIFTAQ